MSSEALGRARSRLTFWAETDPHVSGAALTGSLADGHADPWSDLDLVLGLRTFPEQVALEWTARITAEFGVLHHWDLPSPGEGIVRVHLLGNGVEVDVSFLPEAAFGPKGAQWQLLHGQEQTLDPFSTPDPRLLVGLAWHHTRHARVCVERGRLWQAEYWVGALRTQIIALACLRLNLPTDYAKGAHLLPADVTAALEPSLVRDLSTDEVLRALSTLVPLFLDELWLSDPDTAERLKPTLTRWARR
ncbi:MAG TPA: hypothetical protein H9836_08330 [Candidatus Nocardiopsis merdipullorum]|nr:hypothetical protein [Candidatus Nocardiopsis merdipullorum]